MLGVMTMQKKLIYVANWKMNMPAARAIPFLNNNANALKTLAQTAQIIICPSFISIPLLEPIAKKTSISLGAQDCSAQTSGAFTGQVSADDLLQTGVLYTLVGHSECRINNHDTSALVAQKCLRAIENSITPIICIGETADEKASGNTQNVLTAQLAPVFEVLKNHSTPILLAYEPVWAIGTGMIPTADHLNEIFTFLVNIFAAHAIAARLLYGGSITNTNAAELKKIAHIDGFLIGGASLDFQELKKIVEC